MCGVLFSSPFIKFNAVGQLLFITEVLAIVLKINSIVNYYRLVLIEVICLTVRIKFGQNWFTHSFIIKLLGLLNGG